MGFQSHNEIDRFAYNDCVITEAIKAGNDLNISLDALIVKANNSQNSNFTDSYAKGSVCKISGIIYHKLSRIGFRYYDANDKLISETPDEELDMKDTNLLELMKDMYLYKLEKLDGNMYHLEIETMEEDISIPSDSYELVFEADNIDISWDSYMNRVQN